MPLAEGVSARVAYKFYTDPTITPGVPAVSATDPGPTGGQILRRVASTLAFTKDTYQSGEIRSDYQIADFRHGVRRVAGNVSGELSPLTYQELFAASLRAHWAPAVTATNTDFTGMTPNSTTSTLTFTTGDPVTKGFRVGMGIKFSGLTVTAANNGVTFVITGFGGTSHRTVSVTPAPTTGASEATYAMTSTGSSLVIPTTGQVRRKVAVEVYNSDVDIARLYTECRVGGFTINMPATGMTTAEFSFTGRDMEIYETTAAPFFTAPAAVTTTNLLAAVNGVLRVNGTTVAVVTAMNIQNAITLTGEPVVGSNIVPEIFGGRNVITGQMTAFFQDSTLLNYFRNETEIDLLAYLTTASAPGSPAISFYLPRVKLGGADVATTGEQGQMISMPYQALKYQASPAATSGIENTTLQIWDSEVITGLLREEVASPEQESSAATEEPRLARAG
jgi:Phage tail tube protein